MMTGGYLIVDLSGNDCRKVTVRKKHPEAYQILVSNLKVGKPVLITGLTYDGEVLQSSWGTFGKLSSGVLNGSIRVATPQGSSAAKVSITINPDGGVVL